jgi:formylglycine-generating enzyme
MDSDSTQVFDHFDPFTPHLRLISLGGVRIHEGAWTALEVQQQLVRDYSIHGENAECWVSHDQRSYIQLNNLRLTWDSSLVGMMESQVAILFLDARYNAEWINLSTHRALEELFIWRRSYERQRSNVYLRVFIWIEESHDPQHKLKHKWILEQALDRIQKTLNVVDIGVISMIRSACLEVDDLDQRQRTWSELLYYLMDREFIELAEYQEPVIEQSEYIDAFVLIPAGSFYQGGPSLSSSTERPRHQVKLSLGLWVSQTPVTRALWSSVMGEEWGPDLSGMEPMVDVTWFEALQFCNELSLAHGISPSYEIEDHILPKVTFKTHTNGYRLLTESEWEYACLGGVANSLTAPPLKNVPAWTQERAQLGVHPVAQLDPNPWGLYDCLGNVAEWCQDMYDCKVYSDRKKERLSTDPCVFTGQGSERVVRGGAFDKPEYLVTPYHRDACSPQQRWSSVGFRVARPYHKS